jgi:hypothetical protein
VRCKHATSLRSNLARAVNKGLVKKELTMSTRLATIASRQRTNRARDFLFAAFVALAAVVSLSTVSLAADAAQTIASR